MIKAWRQVALLPLLSAAFLCGLAGCRDTSADQGQSSTSASLRGSTFPALTGRVVDEAGILDPRDVLDLTSKSEALEAATRRQFVIVSVKSLNGRDVAAYTRDLGNAWGIGDEDRDDGVILLVAPNEKQARIAVGTGLEKALTDETAARIMQGAILPRFRAGDLSGGAQVGADALIAELSRPPLP
jgi:uncharacterized protein